MFILTAKGTSGTLALTGTILLLGGCVSHKPIADSQVQTISQSVEISMIAEIHTQTPSDIGSLLSEAIRVPGAESISSSRSVGPQLVAGDWLAWQCAIAGNYFDSTNINNPTSQFASSPTDSD